MLDVAIEKDQNQKRQESTRNCYILNNKQLKATHGLSAVLLKFG